MSKQTTEKAFETYVHSVLTQFSGWEAGTLAEWDKKRALFPERVFDFLCKSQGDLWKQMEDLHGDNLKPLLLSALEGELLLKGALDVLRHGFKFYGKTFRLAYFAPAHGLNPDVAALYAQNQLTVTRQVPCHPGDNSTLDLVFALNGLPVATCELKNPATGQTVEDAKAQFQKQRDPGAPLFEFKRRALVHFAADPDEIWMTTRLQREKTYFLPFNRGSHPGQLRCGAGNPQHSSGHRTAYFWEEILQRDSFLDILGHFLFLEKRSEKVDDGRGGGRLVKKETMVFPRFHQLDAVRNLTNAARREGAGKNYLVQHSAGSGKTNSIAWLGHRLASLHNAKDEKVFDCVVVITDRRVLDQQLQDAIYQIEHAQGVVKAIDDNAKQLAQALIDGTKIVITTLQKFPFVLNGLLRATGAKSLEDATPADKKQAREWQKQIAKRRYAVIIDEAHSSQSGESARELKALLGAAGAELPDDDDWEERLNLVMQSRGKQANLSFFAFTATPKGKTLEVFGRVGASGKPEATHLYSMRQAIEEGFILDVLQNFIDYDTYFNLIKAIEDDPDLPKRKAARALAKFVSLLEHNIEQKTEVIIEHFRGHVQHQLGGRAKAMVVTDSRLHAVRYKLAFDRYLKHHKISDIRPLVAFSGTVPYDGEDYTEPGMNIDCVSGKPIGENQLPERFNSPDYQVLLVANKYQTGFDQPLLCAMYVDKRLDGVQAVQTLSRLNRKIPGKSTPFVLDFRNKPADIYAAFKPYYDATSLREVSNPQLLNTLSHELRGAQVFFWSEVEAFTRLFYRPFEKQNAGDHAQLIKQVQPAVDRFKALETEATREEFRDKLAGYERVYAFLSQILPYTDSELEMLYSFGHFLLPHLPSGSGVAAVNFGDEVELRFYRLERVSSGAIDLSDGDSQGVKSPTDVGTGSEKPEKAPLSEIIEVLNARFATNFDEEDRLFFEQIKQRALRNEAIIQTAKSNNLDKFQLGIKKLVETMMIERMGHNDAIVMRYIDDKAFQDVVLPIMAKELFDSILEKEAPENSAS